MVHILSIHTPPPLHPLLPHYSPSYLLHNLLLLKPLHFFSSHLCFLPSSFSCYMFSPLPNSSNSPVPLHSLWSAVKKTNLTSKTPLSFLNGQTDWCTATTPIAITSPLLISTPTFNYYKLHTV